MSASDREPGGAEVESGHGQPVDGAFIAWHVAAAASAASEPVKLIAVIVSSVRRLRYVRFHGRWAVLDPHIDALFRRQGGSGSDSGVVWFLSTYIRWTCYRVIGLLSLQARAISVAASYRRLHKGGRHSVQLCLLPPIVKKIMLSSRFVCVLCVLICYQDNSISCEHISMKFFWTTDVWPTGRGGSDKLSGNTVGDIKVSTFIIFSITLSNRHILINMPE